MPKKVSIWQQDSRKLIICLIGFCLGIFGILCGMFWEQLFRQMMDKEMILSPDSKMYENWKVPPMALSLDIYLFNWTNPEDFKNLSTKPIFEQLGPYRFTDKPDKVDIRWHPENSTVTYRKKSMFYFDPEGSNGSLDDMVTTLNAVALSAAGKAKQWHPVKRALVDVGFKMYQQEISVIRSVDEMLFTGYQDDMIDMARAMPLFGQDVEVPFDRFGWFYTRNGSADLTGTFNVFTGADDRSKVGQMHSWNYATNTGYFDSYCGMTNGSAGEFYPINLEINGSVSLFSPDMCRTVPLDFVHTEVVEGVLGYKYAGGARSLDNGTIYPENACFCGGNCVPSGVMNITSCRFGSPVFMSYPHFYNADAYYVNQVEGLNPQQKDHEFYMILEPKTGLALEVAARFQVNMLVEPIERISLYENIPRVFMPLIWFEQKVRITPDLASGLQWIPRILIGGQIFAGICFAVGLILLFWYPIERVINGRNHRSHDIKTMTSDAVAGKKVVTSGGNEVKLQKSTAVCENDRSDSPLLEKSSRPDGMILSNTNSINRGHNDSIRTTCTTINVAAE